MKYLKSHPLLIIIIVYLVTRLVNLTLLPVFSDEALYMFWGWQVWEIPGRFWHPLTDAKQPFLTWLFGLGQNIFPDPLFGARFISVLTGLLTLLALWKIGNDFINRKAAILILISYLVSPIFIFFDRQALMESAITASAVWSLFFLLHLLDTHRLKYAIFLGLSLGLGFFTKSSAMIFLATTLIILCIKMAANKKLFYSLSLSLITIIFVFVIVNLPLFFQPLYWETLATNSRWIYTLPEILKFPIHQWADNLLGNTQIAFLFLTPLIFIFALIGMHSALKAKSLPAGRQGYQLKAILLWFFISLTLNLISLKFMNFMSMRYITPFLPPLVIFSAYSLSQKSKWVIGLVLAFPAAVSLLLLLNPITFFRLESRINKYSYIEGYLTGADTGYEVNEIVKYFTPIAKNQKIVVTTAVHTFNPESGVWNYLRKNPNIKMAFLDSRLLGSLEGIDCLKSPVPAYFVAKLNDTTGMENYFDKVTVITNSYNADYSTVYKLKENCPASASSTLTLTTY